MTKKEYHKPKVPQDLHEEIMDREMHLERHLVKLEEYERKKARENYIEGIQGRDGGLFPSERHKMNIDH